MQLPILAYGDPGLRLESEDIDKDYPGLQELIENMFDTMKGASGVGLAAPQVGRPISLFCVDATSFAEPDENGEYEEDAAYYEDFKKVFINAQIIEEWGEEWAFAEGCLSIPGFREDVYRPESIRMTYLDENFVEHEEEFKGIASRIIQHEYDHLEGNLFTDRLSSLRKRMLKRKLTDISKGVVDITYKMRFPNAKKGR